MEQDEIEGHESQAADAAAAREAAQAAKTRGAPTEADLQVERDQALDEARGKAADAAKAKAKEARQQARAPQQKKHGGAEEGAAEGDEDEQGLYDEPSAEDRQWAVDSYGPQVATAMDKAGINAPAANAYWQEHGKLPDSAYDKLADAGYPKAMVDTYLDGVRAASATAAKQGSELAAEVTKIAGSPQAWKRMTDWASQGGMTKAEIDDFNATIDSKSPGAMRIAARALKARFEQANGKLPRVSLAGQQGSRTEEAPPQEDAGGDVFKSTAEISAAQRDPKWQRDPAYRKAVQAKIVRSNLFGKARRPNAGR